MSTATAVELLHTFLTTVFWLGAPLLGTGLVVGIVISLAQILTSIQDPAAATVPRLAAFLAASLVFAPWMIAKLIAYTQSLFSDFSRFVH